MVYVGFDPGADDAGSEIELREPDLPRRPGVDVPLVLRPLFDIPPIVSTSSLARESNSKLFKII